MVQLPRKEKSFWREYYSGRSYHQLKSDLEVDTLIIGAGITGLTTAYQLKKAGQKVAVLEKDSIGSGTTGRTTGKVTSQHGLIYDQLVSQHGLKKTKLYAQANQSAVDMVEKIIKAENINCDWVRDDHYVYTADAGQLKEFRAEAKTARRLDLPASFEKDVPLPFKVAGGVKFGRQGKFNSQKYLLGLAKAVQGGGSFVFENSQALAIHYVGRPYVKTKHATAWADDIVIATHVPIFPLVGRFSYGLFEYPTESYLIAAPLKKTVRGTYISPDDDHYSILPITVDGKKIILIGGEGGNIPGLRLNKEERYERLADYAAKNFGVSEITHKWSDMDYMGYDSLPLIGRLYPWSKHAFTGTGYRKWGLTNGTVAGMIISDLIVEDSSPWLEAFDSTRLTPLKYLPKTAIKQIFS